MCLPINFFKIRLGSTETMGYGCQRGRMTWCTKGIISPTQPKMRPRGSGSAEGWSGIRIPPSFSAPKFFILPKSPLIPVRGSRVSSSPPEHYGIGEVPSLLGISRSRYGSHLNPPLRAIRGISLLCCVAFEISWD